MEAQVENKENILNEKINFEQKENSVEVEVIYEVLENIGTKEKIVFWKEKCHGRKKFKNISRKNNFFKN